MRTPPISVHSHVEWLEFSTHHPATESLRIDRPRYLDIEPVEDYWKWVGTIRYYRRPLCAMIEALSNAGLAVERLLEPLPTDEFRELKPEAYERLLKHPEFLQVRARRQLVERDGWLYGRGAGATESVYPRSLGIPSYGIDGTFDDLDDARAHGRDERIGVAAFAEELEFTYRFMRAIGDAR